MGWTILKIGGDGENFGTRHIEYQIDEESDVQTLPQDQAPGCVAYTADLTVMYRTDNDGIWRKVGG